MLSASQIFHHPVCLDSRSCCPPESCCIFGVSCGGVSLRSWLTLRTSEPRSDTVLFCCRFIIPSMFCVCTPVFMVRCWHLKKSGLNYQMTLKEVRTELLDGLCWCCKHRDRWQTSVFTEHPGEACKCLEADVLILSMNPQAASQG